MDSVRRLSEDPEFLAWRNEEAPGRGDIIVINNSFVFHDVKTNKAGEYLCLVIDEPSTSPEVGVALGMRINADFKRVAAKSKNPPQLVPIRSAISGQLARLGHLVFLLIGEVLDKEVLEWPLHHQRFRAVFWDPTLENNAVVDGDRILVRQTGDEGAIWDVVFDHLTEQGETPPQPLREALGVALDKLQEQAVARVIIPTAGEEARFGITDAILTVLREQRDQYVRAVARCIPGGTQAESALNDVLRIAYNFASDATGFLRLVVSVCDLKPVVLWGTIAEHFTLARAFRAMPWSRSRNKPSLNNYQQTIADARNSAFHNLFPFRKSLRIALPEEALGSPELQIFSEYTKKKDNQLTYQDKELVEVLLEFTRARERSLSLAFWQRNVDLMDATISLFDRTNEFVKILATMRAA
ncbi:MAG TPA: hypothetical protein VFI57_14040 [Pyrinomonadaceae bacterium]|nr:hypothetical protein [Pyrinomonadaceae bacterium]